MRIPVAPALLDIQAPVRDRLDRVPDEMWRIVKADAPIVQAVSEHLQGMKGKMFRPSLLLLAKLRSTAPSKSPRNPTIMANSLVCHLESDRH